MAEKGKLYLIPSPLGDNDPAEVIPQPVLDSLRGFRTFVVEEIRTARRYLSKAGLKGTIGELEFHELNEHTEQSTVEGYLKLFDNGNDVALISEAGLPAVADPGAQLVALAHRHGIEVVPAVGPSSLMMSLMASGLNGQSFAFCGYIPAKTEERKSKLKLLEKISGQLKQTQIIIETPYRNDTLHLLAIDQTLHSRKHHDAGCLYQDKDGITMEERKPHHRKAPVRIPDSRIKQTRWQATCR